MQELDLKINQCMRYINNSRTRNEITETIADYKREQKKLKRDINQLNHKQTAVETFIKNIEDDFTRLLMEQYIIEQKTWRKVERDCSISEGRAKHICSDYIKSARCSTLL